jgi:tetratricopeptide (TPR) repeat protein
MSVNAKVIRVLRRNLKQSLRTRQIRESEELINQLKIDDPVSLETRGFELELLIAKKSWDEARGLAAQLHRLYPGSARIQFLCGRLQYRLKQYDAAREFFEESNRLHPHWIARRWLGKTCTQQGEFDEAESLLLSVLENRLSVNLDLAWLYERTDQPQRALGYVRSYLEKRPNDKFAKSQEIRLKAQTVQPETLSGDINLMLELDEEIPLGMLPSYLTFLLESGQTQSARDFLAKTRSRLDRGTSTSLGWVCYKLQAFDLATDLFLEGFPDRIGDVKYLSVLEYSARRCGRVDELIARYEQEALGEKNLFGRITRLKQGRGN